MQMSQPLGSATPSAPVAAASAAASVALPAAASSPARLEPERFKIIRGDADDYEVLAQLDRAAAAAIAERTGLVISFPPGKSILSVVTTWTEDPRGKLCLGQGASGVFCIGRGVHTHEFVGLKIGQLGEGTRHEVAVQRALKGVPGVLQALDFIETTDQACQVIELAGLGTASKLKILIQGLDDVELGDQILYHISRGLLKSLSKMHDEDYFHLDVKPDNLVVNHRGKVELIDFDCAFRSTESNFDVRELRGDKRYFSPERYFAQWSGARDVAVCSGPKMDAWSAGLLLRELISGGDTAFDPMELDRVLYSDYNELPSALQQELKGFEACSPRQRFELLMARRVGSIPTGGICDVIRGLLTTHPDDRLTVGQALELPWFREMRRSVRTGHSLERLKEMVQHLVLARQSGGAYSPQDLPQLSGVNHVHRRDLQATLRDRLLANAPRTVLQGGYGTGKSQLATFMLTHPAVRARYGSMFWFRACDSQSGIEEQFVILAQEFGLVEQNAGFSEAFPLIKRHLAEQDKPWLIVYDNAGDHTLLAPYLDLTNGHFLITTNSTDWQKLISVGHFSEADAHRLVQMQLQREDSDVPRLCQELTYLPLALAQACAYIRNQQISIAEYLQLIEQSPDALARDERQDGYRDLPYSIQRTYELTFEKLVEKGAMPLLHRIACLAPDQLPKSLLDHLGEPDALNTLVAFGMLQSRGSDTYALHRLPRRVLVSNFSLPDWQEALIPTMKAVYGAWQPNPDSLDAIAINRSLVRHGEALLLHRFRFDPLPDPLRVPLARTMQLAIDILEDVGRPREAIPLLEEIVPLARLAWGVDSGERGGCLNTAGIGWNAVGEHHKAIEYYEQALEIRRRALGDNHPEVAGSLGNLGNAWNALGEHHKAIKYYEPALEIKKRALGDNHPDVASCLDNLGNAWNALGKHRKAIEYHEPALEIRKRALGDNHPHVATSLQNLGAAWNGLGEHRKAIEYHEPALEIRKRALGDNHPHVATSLHLLGNACTSLGEHRKAIEYDEQALEIRKRALGGSHPQVATSLYLLGLTCRSLGEHRKAIEYHEQALEIKKRALGDNHPDVAACLYELGSACRSLGQRRKEIEYREQALEIEKRVLGDNHPDVATRLYELGNAWKCLGERRKEIEYYVQALEIEKRALGDNHPDVATRLSCLGIAWSAIGEPRKAIEYYEPALEIRRHALGGSHPHVAASLARLAVSWHTVGEHGKATEYIQRATAIAKSLSSTEDRSGTAGLIRRCIQDITAMGEQPAGTAAAGEPVGTAATGEPVAAAAAAVATPTSSGSTGRGRRLRRWIFRR